MSQDIIEKINTLKKQKNAVILAHNYQPPEIQDIADFTGDSLGLSIKASNTNADVIVFCGVKFMAETAAILSPQKTVLLPDLEAGCPMADMITSKELNDLKQEHPDALVVCYVNSTVEIKAMSDYCCTSANAVEVVNHLPSDKEIIFVPDQHLGQFVIDETKRNLILWPGYCISHALITDNDIKDRKNEYPNAIVLAHAECNEPVKELADQIQSTSQMLDYVKKSPATQFIIATEIGIIHSLKKVRPDADFMPASEKALCRNMKKIDLTKLLNSLENMEYQITIPVQTAEKAKKSLDRMIQILPKNI